MRSMMCLFVLLAAAACGGKQKSAPAQPAPVAEPAPSNRVEEPPPAATPAVAMNNDSTGSPECDEYLATFDRVRVSCEKQLSSALDALDQSIKAQRDAFAQWKTLDDESRAAAIEAAGPACQAATDALKQAAKSMTPPCGVD